MRKFLKARHAKQALVVLRQQAQKLKKEQSSDNTNPRHITEQAIEKKLAPLIPTIESFRQGKFKQLKTRKNIVLLLFVACIAVGIVQIYPVDFESLKNFDNFMAVAVNSLGYMFGVLVVVVLCANWMHAPTKEYVYDFKKQVMPCVIDAYNPSFTYEYDKRKTPGLLDELTGGVENKAEFPEAEILEKSGIIYRPISIKAQSRDDRLSGVYKNVDFSFTELNSSQNYSRDDYKYGNGFFLLTFSQEFKGHTVVVSDKDKYTKTLTKGRSDINKEKFSPVALEDPVFENVFEVYGTDQQEARYILSPSFMDRLRTLKLDSAQKDTKIQAAFFGHYAIIYLTYYDDLLEPPNIAVPVTNIDSIVQMLKELEKICSLIDELNISLFSKRRDSAAKLNV